MSISWNKMLFKKNKAKQEEEKQVKALLFESTTMTQMSEK